MRLSIDWIIGIVFTSLVTAGLAAIAFWPVRRWMLKADKFDGSMPKVLYYILITTMAATPLIFLGTTWPPFNMEYHAYHHVDGTVTDIETRFVAADSGGSNQMYVVTIGDQIYRCDDSRCSTVHKGDHLYLWCIREWQQSSTPGYDCNYDHVERAKS